MNKILKIIIFTVIVTIIDYLMFIPLDRLIDLGGPSILLAALPGVVFVNVIEIIKAYKKMENERFIYIELNNWAPGEFYPNEKPFTTWMDKWYFRDDKWLKENKICVVEDLVDQSNEYLITIEKSWAEKNCPNIFTKENRKFLRKPDDLDSIRSDAHFLPWCPENFGYHYWDENKEEVVRYKYPEKDLAECREFIPVK